MDDLDLSFGDESSEISAADPNEILSRFEDIDELDAQLFGPKNVSKSPKDENLSKGKKKVSFQEPVKGDTVGKEKSKSQSDDWLFGGDDADDLLAEDPVVNKDNGEKSRVKSNIQSLMRPSTADDILKKSKPAVKKRTLDDFAINPIAPKQEESTSPYTAVQSSKVSKKPEDEFDFGVYKPSLSKPNDSKKKETRRPSFGDDLSFLDDDFFPSTSKASPSQPVGRGKQKLAESDLNSTSSSGTMPGLDNPRPDLKVEPTSAKTGTPIAQSIASKPQATPSRIDPGLASTPPLAAGRNLQRPRRSTDSSQPSAESDSNSVTPTNRLPSHSQKIFQTPIASVQRSFELNGTSTNYNDDADLQTLKAQLEQTRALLHNVELGYKADLEVMKTAHDTQLEMLRSSFHDLKSRVDRDLDSVRESYSARIEVLRTAMNSQLESDTSKECEHQNEIKRLRNLHLQALEDSRLDMETRYDRLKQVHAAEIETIKSSMHDKRNIETMTAKVDESTGKLQQLSSKYESAYKAMTQHSESITLGNKQLISVVQNQLSQQQRSTSDTNMQVQQTVSRLEGLVSEMNRKFEEQHYAVQSSHGLLRSALAALEEERKQFLQQIALEREHLRKAHRELVSVQSDFQRDAQEEHAKLLREAKNLTSATERFEESRTLMTDRSARRNREHDDAIAILNAEKTEFSKKQAQFEAESAKLDFQREHLVQELRKFEKEKETLLQIRGVLERKQHEIDSIARKKQENEAGVAKINAGARQLEEERNRTLAEIQNEREELAHQRQLITEERKALAHERMSGSTYSPKNAFNSPAAGTNRPLPSTPTQRRITAPTQAARTSGAILGSCYGDIRLGSETGSAIYHLPTLFPGPPVSGPFGNFNAGMPFQDQSFLEDEKFFLESVSRSPNAGDEI